MSSISHRPSRWTKTSRSLHSERSELWMYSKLTVTSTLLLDFGLGLCGSRWDLRRGLRKYTRHTGCFQIRVPLFVLATLLPRSLEQILKLRGHQRPDMLQFGWRWQAQPGEIDRPDIKMLSDGPQGIVPRFDSSFLRRRERSKSASFLLSISSYLRLTTPS